MSKKVYVKPYPKEFREQVVQLGDRVGRGWPGNSRFRWIRYGAGCSGRSCQKQRPGSLGRPIRSRKSVRICESEPGPVSDRVDVSRGGRLPQRLLRVAGAAAEPSEHGDPRRVAGDLRGAAGRGSGGAAEAGAGPAGRDASETALHDPQGPGSGRGAGPGEVATVSWTLRCAVGAAALERAAP